MKTEIEVKFEVKNPDFIRKKLKKAGTKFLGKAFERTIRFDTKDKKLEKEGKFLRVRTGFKNVITFKRKIRSKKFREREEIEFEISNPKEMEIILESLGFLRKRVMEKYREKWLFKNAEIVIDKLPMGNYIEIEGTKNEILKTARILNLNFKESIADTYWDLWKYYREKHHIKNENIVFKK